MYDADIPFKQNLVRETDYMKKNLALDFDEK